NLLDGPEQFRGLEQGALDGVGIIAEALVGAEASAGRPAELSANQLLLLGHQLYALADEVMVVEETRPRRRVRRAGGGVQDGALGLCDAVAVAVNPRERVVALGGAEVDENAFGSRGRSRVRLGREDDVGQLLDGLLQAGVGSNGVIPNLVSLGREVDLVVGLAIE